MKNIKLIEQGTIYGFRFLLEVPEEFEENGIIDRYTWSRQIDSIKKNAVEEYKSQIFIEKLEKKSKDMEKTLWYRVGKFMGW